MNTEESAAQSPPAADPPQPAGTTGGPESAPSPPTESNRSSLIWGSLLLVIGGFWLLSQMRLFMRLGEAIVAGAIMVGLSALLYSTYRKRPEGRYGLLIGVGFFSSLAVIAFFESLSDIGPFAPLLFFLGPALGLFAIHEWHGPRPWAANTGYVLAVASVSLFIGDPDWFGDVLGGPVFFWGLALAFAWHFLKTGRDAAILVFGGLMSLGIFAFVGQLNLPQNVKASALLISLAGSLALYNILGKPGKVRWAELPAMVLAVLGVAILIPGLVRFAVPIAFIIAGVLLVKRSSGPRPAAAAAGAGGVDADVGAASNDAPPPAPHSGPAEPAANAAGGEAAGDETAAAENRSDDASS